MKLYGYWQSSATWRVRLALALKDLAYTPVAVDLVEGDQISTDYLSRNPQGLVPTLETEDGTLLTQSLAIILYLENAYPEKPLVSNDPVIAAKTHAIALMIASEAQPFGNRRVLQYLRNERSFDEADIKEWMNRWPGNTLTALESLVQSTGSSFCMGDTPGLADIFLIPQLYAARRFGADIDHLTHLLAIEKNCEALAVFEQAHPRHQPGSK